MLTSTRGNIYTLQDFWSERPSLLLMPPVRGRAWARISPELQFTTLPSVSSYEATLPLLSINGVLTIPISTRHWKYHGEQENHSVSLEGHRLRAEMTYKHAIAKPCSKCCSHTSVLWWASRQEKGRKGIKGLLLGSWQRLKKVHWACTGCLVLCWSNGHGRPSSQRSFNPAEERLRCVQPRSNCNAAKAGHKV